MKVNVSCNCNPKRNNKFYLLYLTIMTQRLRLILYVKR